jgi:hypothetical protein
MEVCKKNKDVSFWKQLFLRDYQSSKYNKKKECFQSLILLIVVTHFNVVS